MDDLEKPDQLKPAEIERAIDTDEDNVPTTNKYFYIIMATYDGTPLYNSVFS